MSNLINVLLKFQLFSNFSPEEIKIFSQYLSINQFCDSQVLLEKGRMSNNLFLILSGKVNIIDETVVIATRSEGELLGEIALIRSSPHMADVVAVSNGEIAIMSYNDIERLKIDHPHIAIKLIAILTKSTLDKLRETEIVLRQRERYSATLVEIQRLLMTAEEESNCYPRILELLGRITGVARLYVFENHCDGTGIQLTSLKAKWCAEGISPEIDNLAVQYQPYKHFSSRWKEALAQGNIIEVVVEEFPEAERQILCQRGILSILSVPIIVQGRFSGFISCDNTGKFRKGDTAEIDLMKSIAASIGLWQERQRSQQALRMEQEKSERLLLNILPEAIAKKLKKDQSTIAEYFSDVTILFADIVGFTPLAAQVSPIELVNLLNKIFSTFDQLTELYNLEKIKTIGDAYMVVGGLPVAMNDHVEAIADIALDMQNAITSFPIDGRISLSLRIGIHTGSVVAGVIGIKKFIYDLWGDTVNVASRMESHGEPGRIHVTAATYERLQDKYEFEKRGAIAVKGKGQMITYWLKGRKCQMA